MILLPETILLFIGVAFCFTGLIRSERLQAIARDVLAIGGFTGVFAALHYLSAPDTMAQAPLPYAFSNAAFWFKLLFAGSAFLAILLARNYTDCDPARGKLRSRGEFFGLITLCTVGSMAMVSAVDLLSLFVAMELATIPLYILAAYYKKDQKSGEGALKYVLTGSVATALLLFGYSYVYGATGSIDSKAIAYFASAQPNNRLLLLGAILLVAGTGFKLAMVPFHMWAPDVYHGSPTPVTAFLALSSKATALAFLAVLFTGQGPLAPVRPILAPWIAGCAAASMLVGNMGAMRQRGLRRFMGYSSIAQVGYALFAFLVPEGLATGALLFFLFAYAITNYCTFFVFVIACRGGEEHMDSLRGLSKASPALAALLMLCMFSLAGIPPLAGFLGKFALFAAIAKAGQYGLLLFGALNAAISLYYYLLVIKAAYIEIPERPQEPLRFSLVELVVILILGAAVLALGILPQGYETLVRLEIHF